MKQTLSPPILALRPEISSQQDKSANMTSWYPKPLSTLIFRTVQRCIQVLPARLLRIRPFGVYEIRLGKRTSKPMQAATKSPCQVRWVANQADAHRLVELATAENIAAWNGTTRRAAFVWQESQPLGVAWIAAEWFAEDELGLHYRLADDEVWLFAAVVAPKFRRQGHYHSLLEFLREELSREEVQRILLGVSMGNKPSQYAHAGQNARQLGTIFAAKCLGLAFCKVGGRVRRVSKRGWAWRRAVELVVDRTDDLT